MSQEAFNPEQFKELVSLAPQILGSQMLGSLSGHLETIEQLVELRARVQYLEAALREIEAQDPNECSPYRFGEIAAQALARTWRPKEQ